MGIFYELRREMKFVEGGSCHDGYAEDKTRIRDMNVRQILNIARKTALNLIRIYKEANCTKNTSLTRVMKANLFDADVLSGFLDFLDDGDLWNWIEVGGSPTVTAFTFLKQ